MKIKKYIPNTLLYAIELMRIRRRFQGREIYTHRIGSNVNLGSNVAIASNVEIRSGVEIDNYSYVNQGTTIVSGKIGKYTSIGCNCQIGLSEHPTNYISTSPHIYGKNNIFGIKEYWCEIFSPPTIGNDVWVGNNCIILQGVKIGDGVIIAAGAVVTKDVEPFTIVGGVPARRIKKRFNEEKIRYLMDFKWWDFSIDELKKYKNVFIKKERWFDSQ